MKTKLPLILILSVLGAGGTLATPLQGEAGEVAAAIAADSAGLLGRTYSGLEFGYTHHVEGPPGSLRRFGFVSSRPIVEEAQNVDAAFRYNYTRGSLAGGTWSRHDGAMSFTGYLPPAEARPFVRGDVGWVWSQGAGNSENAFQFLVGGGIEIVMTPRMALTPFIHYQDAPDLDERAVWFGAQTSYRFDRVWSGTFTLQIDNEHNIEYALGMMRRF